jgi:hypothetical protein
MLLRPDSRRFCLASAINPNHGLRGLAAWRGIFAQIPKLPETPLFKELSVLLVRSEPSQGAVAVWFVTKETWREIRGGARLFFFDGGNRICLGQKGKAGPPVTTLRPAGLPERAL